jgi:hypothetical protein
MSDQIVKMRMFETNSGRSGNGVVPPPLPDLNIDVKTPDPSDVEQPEPSSLQRTSSMTRIPSMRKA